MSMLRSILLTMLLTWTGAAIAEDSPWDPIGIKLNINEIKLMADQGDPKAQTQLALAYLNGWGVAKDPVQGVSWIRKGADRGDATAQFNMGEFYRTGVGVTQDEMEAMRWYQLAADQGHGDAQSFLAQAYMNGTGGMRRDYVKAYVWNSLSEGKGSVSVDSMVRRRQLEDLLSRDQLAEARRQVQEWNRLRQ